MAGDIQKSADGTIVDSDGNPVEIETSMDVVDMSATSDTPSLADNGRTFRCTNASLVTITLPVDLPVNFIVEYIFWGAAGGAVQDDGTSVVHPEGAIAQYKAISCLVVDTNTWSVVGQVS